MTSLADRTNYNFRLDILPDPGPDSSFPDAESFYCAMELAQDGVDDTNPWVEYIDLPAPAFTGLFILLELLGPARTKAFRVVRFPAVYNAIESLFAVFGFRTGCGAFVSVAENGVPRWVSLESSNGSEPPNYYAFAATQEEVDDITHNIT